MLELSKNSFLAQKVARLSLTHFLTSIPMMRCTNRLEVMKVIRIMTPGIPNGQVLPPCCVAGKNYVIPSSQMMISRHLQWKPLMYYLQDVYPSVEMGKGVFMHF